MSNEPRWTDERDVPLPQDAPSEAERAAFWRYDEQGFLLDEDNDPFDGVDHGDSPFDALDDEDEEQPDRSDWPTSEFDSLEEERDD